MKFVERRRSASASGRRPSRIYKRRSSCRPRNAFTRLNLGTALYLSGDASGAAGAVRGGRSVSPRNYRRRITAIGVLMEAAGRDNEAIDTFSAAVQVRLRATSRRACSWATRSAQRARGAESLPQYAEVIEDDRPASQALRVHHGARPAPALSGGARPLAEGVRAYPDQARLRKHALARLLAAAPDDGVRDGRSALALMEPLLKQQNTIGSAETMAMALAEVGRIDEAAVWQREAIAAAKGSQPDAVPRLEQNLTLYESGKPCRTPWRNDDPVFHPRPQ